MQDEAPMPEGVGDGQLERNVMNSPQMERWRGRTVMDAGICYRGRIVSLSITRNMNP